MTLGMGKRQLELGGPLLGFLRDSTEWRDNPEALRERMREDGYLLIRRLHDPEKVRAARNAVLRELDRQGVLDRSRPLEEGVSANKGRSLFLGGRKQATHTPEFLALVEAPELMDFFTRFLGAESVTYDFKWLRAVGTGGFTGAHYDIVYMGRGTPNVYTVWTPLGDVPYEMAPLAVLEGSHHFDRLKETYGQMDVDRDHVVGAFSDDPIELVEKYGGRWLTTEFEMGDALIFGMFTMHGALNNATDRFRLSCDTRYQRADEPVDERWIGENPIAHYAWTKGETVSMEEARKRWKV